MNERLIEQLRKISPEEENILKSGKSALAHYVKQPDSNLIDQEVVMRPKMMIDLLKQPRFVDFPTHSHNYLEVTYMISGSAKCLIDQAISMTLQTGDLLFLKQGTCHSVEAPGYNDIAIHFLILPEFLPYPLHMLQEDTVLRQFILGCMNHDSNSELYLHFHLQDMLEAQNLLENMILSLLRSQRNNQRILQATMGVLLLELSNRTHKITIGSPTSYEQQIVLEAMAYIEENYQSASLNDFCQKYNQPSYYISRLMKRFSPYTFTKYLQKRRLAQAVYLLTETTMAIESIITQVGYENSSHFYRLFKEEYGINPKEYRKKYMVVS